MKYIVLIVALALSFGAMAQDSLAPSSMSEQQLEHYPFPKSKNDKPPVISELSVGQAFVLNHDRRAVKALLARYVGILDLHRNTADLEPLQELIDSGALKKSNIKEWQELGVVFGDILVNEFHLHWVSYADDKGVSTALQWKDTQNFVFPVTLFSKRVQFDEKLDARALYRRIAKDIRDFIQYANTHPQQPGAGVP